jgi:hypothetical protein
MVVPRPGRVALLASVILIIPVLGLVLRRAESRLEQEVRLRLEAEAARLGVSVEVGGIHAGLYPLLHLDKIRIERPGFIAVTADSLDLFPRLGWGGYLDWLRLRVGHATVAGLRDLSLEIQPTQWFLEPAPPGGVTGRLCSPADALRVAWLPRRGGRGRLEVVARDFPAGQTLQLSRQGVAILDAGVVGGWGWIEVNPGSVTFNLDGSARDVRVAAFAGEASARGEDATLGRNTDLGARLKGRWEPGSVRFSRFWASSEGASLSGDLALTGLPKDPAIELSFAVDRLDFSKVLATTGLAPTTTALGSLGSDGALGSAFFSADVRGRLLEPASFTVAQKLDFARPARFPPEIERLKSDFVHEAVLPDGTRKLINVSRSSPDFVPLGEVPSLFIRTLLIGEDAGFYSHSGIDFSEVPAAIATNWARGTTARGASTITQQLAKNLFLSREKRLSRKVQELALALLLEASLGKERILEIYLNVIEWGPGLYGLGPASRHYFRKEPSELSPKQMAFLVALIPGPVKYQSSFAGGTPSAGFLPLVNDLLLKLRSVDALTDGEYEAALAESLTVETGGEGRPPEAEVQN